jgi:AcrR family transcriptional regulator
MPTRRRAQRMSPKERREQILDSAADLIVTRGLTSCTLEGVAAHALISKPLIYKYFPRLEDLLKALVEREYGFLRSRSLRKLPANMPYEEVMQRAAQRALEYFYERGPIMRLLASDRTVVGLAANRERDERDIITSYFIRRTMRLYGLPADVAKICVTMAVNAPILSARALRRAGVSAKRAAEVWGAFMMGGNEAVAAKYGARKNKLSVRKSSRGGRKET